RADAALLIGADETGIAAALADTLPLLRARLAPTEAARALAGRRVVAFAGIGRPDKFFATLQDMGCEIVEAVPYPDHHPYRPEEIMRLCEMASETGAEPVTTEKDAARLSPDARLMVRTVPIELIWDDEDAIDTLLFEMLARD
ncbi:MAG: tetraacyldisaccharide 4'-kinase, partial [Alphaproteobacteria bacterium]